MAAVQNSHWWYAGRRTLLRGVLESTLKMRPEGNVEILEIGAGAGSNAGVLEDFGTVTLVEPVHYAADLLRQTHPACRVIESDWPAASTHMGRYDVVVMLDVLEHIDDDVAALKATRSVLNAGGFVILSVPTHRWMWSQHDVELLHHRRYSRLTLRHVIEQAGYAIRSISGFNTVLLPVAWLARVLHLPGGADDRLPAPFLNIPFTRVLNAEARLLLRGWRMPTGLSTVAVLTPREHS